MAKQLTMPMTGTLFEPEVKRELPIRAMKARGLGDEETLLDFPSDTHVLEIKYDGHRILIEIGSEITAWSRAGNLRYLPPHIIAELRQMAPGFYDTELWISGHTSTDVVRLDLQSKLELSIFDILRVDTTSTMHLPLYQRRDLLKRATNRLNSDAVYVVPQFDPSPEMLKEIFDAGGEGVIVKHRESIYEPDKRPKTWRKIKKGFSGLARIVEFKPGLLGPHSVIIAVDDKGNEVRMKSLNDEWRADFSQNAAKYLGKMIRFNAQEQTRSGRYKSAMADHIED